MLKKSLYLPLACALPLTTYAENLSTEMHPSSHIEQVFHSKTYFLMAVDNEIKSAIQYDDVSKLLGLPAMSKEDAETVLFGMRKSLLKYAARAWDTGVAVNYGKEVSEVIGLETIGTDEVDETSLQNKLLLFRYAQQYDNSKQVIDRYSEQLDPLVESLSLSASLSNQDCINAEPHSDYEFYQKLSTHLPKTSTGISLAKKYEILMPCQKLALGDFLEQNQSNLSKATFQRGIASVIAAN
ncbi:MAG: hypothetical protein KC467_11545 [Marinomonas atlantica]|nr:hypothetical protein [Marinomonas atlantica]